MSRDPVSWLLIAPGWEVVDSEGELVGIVAQLIGDPDRDIFDGLSVTSHDPEPRYVPSERVEMIVEGRIVLGLTAPEFRQLDERAPGP